MHTLTQMQPIREPGPWLVVQQLDYYFWRKNPCATPHKNWADWHWHTFRGHPLPPTLNANHHKPGYHIFLCRKPDLIFLNFSMIVIMLWYNWAFIFAFVHSVPSTVHVTCPLLMHFPKNKVLLLPFSTDANHNGPGVHILLKLEKLDSFRFLIETVINNALIRLGTFIFAWKSWTHSVPSMHL